MADLKEVKVTAIKIPAFTFPKELQEKWLNNIKTFTAPLLTMYVAQLLVEFTKVAGGESVINGSMFIPSQIVLGGMGLYVLNALMDLFTKWKNPTTLIK